MFTARQKIRRLGTLPLHGSITYDKRKDREGDVGVFFSVRKTPPPNQLCVYVREKGRRLRPQWSQGCTLELYE